jgi:hypothetical protein
LSIGQRSFSKDAGQESSYICSAKISLPRFRKTNRLLLHQGREIIAIVPLENGAFCTIFSENFHKF